MSGLFEPEVASEPQGFFSLALGTVAWAERVLTWLGENTDSAAAVATASVEAVASAAAPIETSLIDTAQQGVEVDPVERERIVTLLLGVVSLSSLVVECAERASAQTPQSSSPSLQQAARWRLDAR